MRAGKGFAMGFGEGTASNRPKTAQERAADAAVSLATAQARERRSVATTEYEDATRGLSFTKDFNTAQEAVMRDPMATLGQRFLAWLKRNSWGEYSLFAIGPDGLPKFQVDCCRELGCDKSRLSHVVAYYEMRGYVRVEGKVLYPVISPVFGPDPKKLRASATFLQFIEHWKVANASNFQEYEVARATYSRIRKVLFLDYKKWKAQQKKAAASLLEIARDQPVDPAGSEPLTPLQESEQRRRARSTQPKTPSVDGGQQSKDRAAAARRAADYLFSEIDRMQKDYPDSEFSKPRIDPKSPHHQQLVQLIMIALGNWEDEEYLVGYCMWIGAQFKGPGSGARSKSRAPGMSSGPKSLGLLLNWASDYARIASEGANGAAGGE
jgi:hypothetical protein